MTDYSYRSNYRPLKDIEQDNNKLMARNSALSGENSELKQLLIYANRDLEGNVAYIAYLKKQLKEKAS
jgi:hypothetical protein